MSGGGPRKKWLIGLHGVALMHRHWPTSLGGGHGHSLRELHGCSRWRQHRGGRELVPSAFATAWASLRSWRRALIRGDGDLDRVGDDSVVEASTRMYGRGGRWR